MKQLFILFCISMYSLSFSQKPASFDLHIDAFSKEYVQVTQKRKIAYSLKNIGNIYKGMHEVKKALDYYHRSLHLYTEANDLEGVAITYFDIGKLINTQGDRKKALDYKEKSNKVKETIQIELAFANTQNKMAFEDYKKFSATAALNKYGQSAKIYLQLNDKQGLVNALNNMGIIYDNQKDKDLALQCLALSKRIKDDHKERVGEIQKEINDPEQISYSFNRMSTVYANMHDCQLAYAYADSAFLLAKEFGYRHNLCLAESLMWISDSCLAAGKITGSEKFVLEAKKHLKNFRMLQDSIKNSAPKSQQPDNKVAIAEPIQKPEKNNQLVYIWIIPVSCLLMGFVLYWTKKNKKR